MSDPFLAIKTADIQWIDDLPRSTQYDDIYYAKESGIEQCRYVFIDGNNLISRWQAVPQKEPYQFSIAETGFGTGLNFLLTWHYWERYAPESARLHFISCERHPLTAADLDRALSSWPELGAYKEQLIAQYPLLTPGNHHLFFAAGRVKLTLMLGDCLERFSQLVHSGDAFFEQQLKASTVDAWFLDGFAPKKNEAMWSMELFAVIAMLSSKETTFATYTAAGEVKNALVAAGFTVVKKKGFKEKRHMLTGCKQEVLPHRLKQRSTPWHYTASQVQEQSALIIGGGLAGCFCAYALAQRGFKVTLIEKEERIALAASGNQRAVLFPKLSAFHSPFTEFMLASFLYAHQFYKSLLQEHTIGELKGALVLPSNAKEKNAHDSLRSWLVHYPQLGELVATDKATALAGIKIPGESLFIPYSGWINSPALCQLLISDNERISRATNTEVKQLRYEGTRWHVNEYNASVLILANGYQINSFTETQFLPVKPIGGQMTCIPATEETACLSMPICGTGHVLPAGDGVHYLGATYNLGDSSSQLKSTDDESNLAKLEQLTPEVPWSRQLVGHWFGVRATTPDYLPLVGPIPKGEQFLARYAGFASNSKRWLPYAAPYYPNLYACAGFGSRGLTTIPLSAEWLAAHINGELSGAPRNLLQALAPARFLRRAIMRKTVDS